MNALGTLVLSAVQAGELRPLYLLLLLLAIILILVGCIIAVVTLRNQRKNGQIALLSLEQLDREDL